MGARTASATKKSNSTRVLSNHLLPFKLNIFAWIVVAILLKHYRHMELAEYLLDHMHRTTSAYQELQDKEARLASDLALAQAQLFPLRKENSRLTRENHQLHLDNIRQQDESSNMFADQGVRRTFGSRYWNWSWLRPRLLCCFACAAQLLLMLAGLKACG